ncbi:hypothetical protein ACFE04_000566 [Oxalis oulophora]
MTDPLACEHEKGIDEHEFRKPESTRHCCYMKSHGRTESFWRVIGVSNFSIKKLQTLLETAQVPPLVNQVECHPAWQQHKLCLGLQMGPSVIPKGINDERIKEKLDVFDWSIPED